MKRSRKRAARRAPAAPPAPAANVLVHPNVLHDIASASARAGGLETGGPLIGTVQRSWDSDAQRLIVFVLATLPPGPAVRGSHASVALGAAGDGERAASALRWWRDVTGLDLLHLGDWHKHPSGLPEPSSGDGTTAGRLREQAAAPVWLSAIAVGNETASEETKMLADGAAVRSRHESAQEIRFFRERGLRGLQPVDIRVEGAALPRLPALPWHVADPARFAMECRLLQAAGFRVSVGASPNEPGVLLRLSRDGAGPITVATGARHPAAKPTLLDERGVPIRTRGTWSSARFLVDLAGEVS